MTGFDIIKRSWPAYGAAVWSLVFAFFHMVWAMGWYVGLEQETARRAFDTTWKLVYDIVIAGLCVLGVCLGLAFVQPWGDGCLDGVSTLLAGAQPGCCCCAVAGALSRRFISPWPESWRTFSIRWPCGKFGSTSVRSYSV